MSESVRIIPAQPDTVATVREVRGGQRYKVPVIAWFIDVYDDETGDEVHVRAIGPHGLIDNVVDISIGDGVA